MHIGFTGTQHGMTPKQLEQLSTLLVNLSTNGYTDGYIIAHHGDCIGADFQFHNLVCKVYDSPVVYVHAPSNPSKRAFCRKSGNEVVQVLPVKPYIERNHDIVDNSSLIFATPNTMRYRPHSGTWVTINYAKCMEKHLIIIYPDGSMEEFNK